MQGLSCIIADISFQAFLDICLMENIFLDYVLIGDFPLTSASAYRDALETLIETNEVMGIGSYIPPLLFTLIIQELPLLITRRQSSSFPPNSLIFTWLRAIFDTPTLRHIFLSKQESRKFIKKILVDLQYHAQNHNHMDACMRFTFLLEKEIDQFRRETWAARRKAFDPFKKELMAAAWHPRRVAAWLERGMSWEELDRA